VYEQQQRNKLTATNTTGAMSVLLCAHFRRQLCPRWVCRPAEPSFPPAPPASPH